MGVCQGPSGWAQGGIGRKVVTGRKDSCFRNFDVKREQKTWWELEEDLESAGVVSGAVWMLMGWFGARGGDCGSWSSQTAWGPEGTVEGCWGRMVTMVPGVQRA